MTTTVSTARAAMLSQELRRFPHILEELLAFKDDVYYLMLSSKPYDVPWSNRGKKPPVHSQVERIVVTLLGNARIAQLESYKAACDALLDDCASDDRTLLLSFWRGEFTGLLPDTLLFRYSYYRDEYGLPDDFLVPPDEL